MKVSPSRWFVPLFVVVGVVACGGGSQQPSTASSVATDDGKAQAARGAKLYADKCASCHGANGEGDKDTPPVVGKDALPLDPRPESKYRKVQFRTALDVAVWVVKNMPPKEGSSLKESEYWDILAFDLEANGVPVAGLRIDEKTAAGIKLH